MAIQVGNPAYLRFDCRLLDEYNRDIGPVPLTDPEYQPLVVRLKRPGDTEYTIEIENADIVLLNDHVGEWRAASGQLDRPGLWQAQLKAGDWKSRTVGFHVIGN